MAEDFSMSVDLSAKHPDKLKELQEIFLAEAAKYKVLPIDDRMVERVNSLLAGRPDIMAGRTTLTAYAGLGFLSENDFINTKRASFDIVAEIEAAVAKTNGVIVSQAGRLGGWRFYVKAGKPIYVHNYPGLNSYEIRFDTSLPSGPATVKLDFACDGQPKLRGRHGHTLFQRQGRRPGPSRKDAVRHLVGG